MIQMLNVLLILFSIFLFNMKYVSSACVNWEKFLSNSAETSFTLSSCDGSIGPIPGSIPGDIYNDLINSNIITKNPYFRYEEKNLSWISQTCWQYVSSPIYFDDKMDIFYNSNNNKHFDTCPLMLSFNNIDGPAKIYLNDHLIGHTINAHREHVFVVDKTILQYSISHKYSTLLQKTHETLKDRYNLDGNILRIELIPSLRYAKEQSNKYKYSVPATVNYNVWAEPTHRNFIRKAGSDFGWDWGPAFVSTGISGSIKFFQVIDGIKLDGIMIEQIISDDYSNVDLIFTAFLTNYNTVVNNKHSNDDDIRFTIYIDNNIVKVIDKRLVCSSNDITKDRDTCLVNLGIINKSNPILWWPRGFGDQNKPHLYRIDVKMQNKKGMDADKQIITKFIGIRKVELIEDKIIDDSLKSSSIQPKTFYFKINGQEIFIKGANMIPIDSFPSKITPKDREYILKSSYEANMNMLRVWGGGVYQPDDFYDMADRLGIMIWQETMFACAMYPRDQQFLNEVSQEIKYQALRLGLHPSIVIWGGNNENEIALEWFDETLSNRDLYVADYVKLYGDTIYPTLLSIFGNNKVFQTQFAWVDSSPSNGLLSIDPYVKLWGTPSTTIAGDMHYYDYYCDCENYQSYPNAKFISEFGFQSMPSFLSYQSVTIPEDWNYNSDLMQYRQRHQYGNDQIYQQIDKHFIVPIPSCSDDRITGRSFDMYLYLTNIQQSRCYETAVHNWRQNHGIDHINHHYTMGILYWQLNNIWQGPSWSSMEYGGRWKPLMYTIKRSYDPILLSITYDQSNTTMNSLGIITIYLVNDYPESYVGNIVIELVSWSSDESFIVADYSQVHITKSSSLLVGTILIDQLKLKQCTIQSCYIRGKGTITSESSTITKNIESYVPMTTMKNIQLSTASPIITMNNFRMISSNEAQFDVRSTITSPFFFLEVKKHSHGLSYESSVATSFNSNNMPEKDIPSEYDSKLKEDGLNEDSGWFVDNNILLEMNRLYTMRYVFYQDIPYSQSLIRLNNLKNKLQGRVLQHVYDCSLPFITASD